MWAGGPPFKLQEPPRRGCPVLRVLCEGRVGLRHYTTSSVERTRVVRAASPPTLAKNARMGHPPCGGAMQRWATRPLFGGGSMLPTQRSDYWQVFVDRTSLYRADARNIKRVGILAVFAEIEGRT